MLYYEQNRMINRTDHLINEKMLLKTCKYSEGMEEA